MSKNPAMTELCDRLMEEIAKRSAAEIPLPNGESHDGRILKNMRRRAAERGWRLHSQLLAMDNNMEFHAMGRAAVGAVRRNPQLKLYLQFFVG